MNELRDDLDFARTYGSVPDSFQHRVQYALRGIEEEKTMRRPTLRTIAIVIALLSFATAACAAVISRTVDVYGSIFGEAFKKKLEAGELAVSGATYEIGGMVFTLDDAVFARDGLYAAGTIKPVKGANIVLIPEDFDVNDPAGHMIGYAGVEVPEGAATYRELAEASGAKLMRVKCRFDNNADVNNPDLVGTVGAEWLPRTDGSIVFCTEFDPVVEYGSTMEAVRDGERKFKINILYTELTLDGEEIEGSGGCSDWIVSIIPEG